MPDDPSGAPSGATPSGETDAIVAFIERWHGIRPPNDFALRAAADLAKVMADLARVRNTLRFEDEPASFETALLEASGLPASEWNA